MSEGQGREFLRCGFCRRTQDEIAMLVGRPEMYICDECVDDCIVTLVEADVLPDLRPLEKQYIVKPAYLTPNDVRGSLSLLEFDSLSDDGREELVRKITRKIANDDLLKKLMDAVNLRMYQWEWEGLREAGLDDEARYRPDVLRAITAPRPRSDEGEG